MKIAYVMLVDWRWIKQRPHFIAEGLAQNHDVTVFYQFRYGLKGAKEKKPNNITLKPIFVIPRGDRNPTLRKCNHLIKKYIISRYIKKNKPDTIYLTYPDQIDCIPDGYLDRIVYDCMDNHAAFISDETERNELVRKESKMIETASDILVSSEKLKEIILQRYGAAEEKRISVVRNAFNGVISDRRVPISVQSHIDNSSFTIAYFGTIGQWFDFDILLKSIKDFPNIRYVLIGPISDVEIPASSNIEYRGTVAHEDLFEAIADADCFIMPFVINDITAAVDPVKLYEYINFQKNILCIEYPEVKRFAPFVYFYSDYNSFKEQILKLLEQNTTKYTEKERVEFLQSNDWSSRVKLVERLMTNGN